MPVALYALTAGAFGIGVTEFVIMGLLLNVSRDLHIRRMANGMVIDHGPGLAYVPVVAALFPLLAIAVSLIGVRLERPRTAAVAA